MKFVRFVFPIPLFLIDQTLEACSDLFWLWNTLFPGLTRKAFRSYNHSKQRPEKEIPFTADIDRTFGLCRRMIRELRHYGRWRMVEVKTGKESVFIDFV